jgi:type I site-specific restriction endonuclease
MTWGWRDCKNGRLLEPWPIKLSDTGKEVSQMEIADRIQRFLEERKPVIFRSAPGTGKTLPAVEAMVRVTHDDLMNGKPILYLTPTKSLQKDLLRRLSNELCYFIDSDQKLEVYDILGRKEIPCPWWRARMDLSATAVKCVRSSCPLYFPLSP